MYIYSGSPTQILVLQFVAIGHRARAARSSPLAVSGSSLKGAWETSPGEDTLRGAPGHLLQQGGEGAAAAGGGAAAPSEAKGGGVQHVAEAWSEPAVQTPDHP